MLNCLGKNVSCVQWCQARGDLGWVAQLETVVAPLPSDDHCNDRDGLNI